ncbi:receptor activity-modifying protein 1 [Garra rufa]|uniref:receptor activity-modifying protein 1 n=1 Tax=Garra rufa TaxID=137080 RepID=UPI003CCE870D
MFFLSGLLLLLLDLSVIGGQTKQDNKTAIEDESIRVKNESVQQELNKLLSTERPGVVYESDENFQTQGFQVRYSHCYEELLNQYGEACWYLFNDSMSELGEENWCNMDMVIRNYNKLTECMELVSSSLRCFYPNRVVEQLFVRIHQQYFILCRNEEDLSDAPAGVVLVSTLLPIILLSFIVYIVVWKSSLRD